MEFLLVFNEVTEARNVFVAWQADIIRAHKTVVFPEIIKGLVLMVTGEKRELTNLRKGRNKNEEMRKHICEIIETQFPVN